MTSDDKLTENEQNECDGDEFEEEDIGDEVKRYVSDWLNFYYQQVEYPFGSMHFHVISDAYVLTNYLKYVWGTERETVHKTMSSEQ